MKKSWICAIAVLVPTLAFSAAAFAEGNQTPRSDRQGKEVLMGIYSSSEGVTFQVASGGCTDKDSFELVVRESFPPQITLIRLVADSCEGHFPFGTMITYSWNQISTTVGGPFIMENRIATGGRKNHLYR